MLKTNQNTPTVEEIGPNGMSPARFELLLTGIFIPLAALVMWYLGKVRNPELSWSWNDYLMNLLYSVFFVLAMRQAIEVALKVKTWIGSVTVKITLAGLATYLVLQSLVVFVIEGLNDLNTIMLVYAVGLLLVAAYIIVKLFLVRLKTGKPQKKPLLKAQYKGKTTFISIDQVECVYTENKVAYAYVPDKTLLLSQTLTELEKELPSQEFFRINRQCIVSKSAINQFERQANNTLSLQLKTYKEVLSVSRAKTPAFIAWVKEGAQ